MVAIFSVIWIVSLIAFIVFVIKSLLTKRAGNSKQAKKIFRRSLILLCVSIVSFFLIGYFYQASSTSSANTNVATTSTASPEPSNPSSPIDVSSYLDAVRGNLSTAKMTLYDVTSHDEKDGPVYEMTFDNPELGENSQVNSISVNTTNEYFFGDATLVCPNSGWVYIYAYCVIGSIRGNDGLKDILSQMKIDMNNGYYGTTQDVYHDTNWDYIITYLDNKVILMIDPANQ